METFTPDHTVYILNVSSVYKETICNDISRASIIASIKRTTSTSLNGFWPFLLKPSCQGVGKNPSKWFSIRATRQFKKKKKRHLPQEWHRQQLQLTSPLKPRQVFIKDVWKCTSERITSCFTHSLPSHILSGSL